MRPRSRVAVWSVIVPIVTLLIGFVFRGALTPAASSQPVTPIVVTQIVEKQVPVTQVVEKQVTQIVERPVLVTQLVERTQVVQQPVEVTRVVEVTRIVSQTVAATPAPNPSVQAAALQFGESFSGQNMILTAKAPRRDVCGGSHWCMLADFTVENRTGGSINFDGQLKGFYLDFGTTTRFIADGSNHGNAWRGLVATFNDFGDRSSQGFAVTFPISPDEFDTLLRNPDVKYVEVVAEGFDPRVPKATWQQQIMH